LQVHLGAIVLAGTLIPPRSQILHIHGTDLGNTFLKVIPLIFKVLSSIILSD